MPGRADLAVFPAWISWVSAHPVPAGYHCGDALALRYGPPALLDSLAGNTQLSGDLRRVGAGPKGAHRCHGYLCVNVGNYICEDREQSQVTGPYLVTA